MHDGSPSAAPLHTPADSARAGDIARALLDIGAVALRPEKPFTWSSGLVAPIYCDNRRTLAHPRVRRALRDGFVNIVGAHDLTPATIAGTATAGIPHAAWLAEATDQPMAYVRSEVKGHGKGRRIEGDISSATTAVLVEDLVSTGGSAITAVEALRGAGLDVQAVLSIFSYGLDAATHAFRDADMPLHVLCDFQTLADIALERDELDASARTALQSWRADPSAWSAQRGGTRLDR